MRNPTAAQELKVGDEIIVGGIEHVVIGIQAGGKGKRQGTAPAIHITFRNMVSKKVTHIAVAPMHWFEAV